MHPRVVGTGIYKGRLAMEHATHPGGKMLMKKWKILICTADLHLHARVVYVEPAALEP